tara:strand:- start:122 stop:649 length:528 start_codon:yes stop_codon:yes gene_type:complete
MLLENNLKKYKEAPESIRGIVGLVGLTTIIIFSFIILNIFIGTSDKSAKDNKSVENNEALIASLPKGRLNFFEGSQGHKLSASEYEAVCNNTKIVTQRAVMGALITDYKAQKLYNDNGNLIEKYFVKWNSSSNKCEAGYTLKPLKGTTDTFTISGEAKGFFKTSIDTRVYFIKNY